MGTGSFPGVNRPGRGVDHPPPSSAEVEGRVELYIFSLSGPSWPVLGWTYYFAGFQVCDAVYLRCSLFWDVTELWLVVSPEMMVTNYQQMARSIPGEPSLQLLFSLPVIRLWQSLCYGVSFPFHMFFRTHGWCLEFSMNIYTTINEHLYASKLIVFVYYFVFQYEIRNYRFM